MLCNESDVIIRIICRQADPPPHTTKQNSLFPKIFYTYVLNRGKSRKRNTDEETCRPVPQLPAGFGAGPLCPITEDGRDLVSYK